MTMSAHVTIECELRSFLTEGQHKALLGFFSANAKALGEDEQVTYYYDAPQDVRIQRNRTHAKIWLKKGSMHDDAREEIEVPVAKEDFSRLEALFEAMGYGVKIKWFRTRRAFDWAGVRACLDHTVGYGHILELEMMTDRSGREETLRVLRAKMEQLGVRPTPKPIFNERFEYYRAHWRELLAADRKEKMPA